MWEVIDFLAQTRELSLFYSKGALLSLRFLAFSFTLYLCAQALIHLPFVQGFMVSAPGRLVIFVLLLGLTAFFLYWAPSLRILHEIGLLRSARVLIWPDIALSTLAIVRFSYLWSSILDWFSTQSR